MQQDSALVAEPWSQHAPPVSQDLGSVGCAAVGMQQEQAQSPHGHTPVSQQHVPPEQQPDSTQQTGQPQSFEAVLRSKPVPAKTAASPPTNTNPVTAKKKLFMVYLPYRKDGIQNTKKGFKSISTHGFESAIPSLDHAQRTCCNKSDRCIRLTNELMVLVT